MSYPFREIEQKWQREWETQQLYRTPEILQGPKYYVLDMFPYPSGAGLHVGHPEGYTATDIVARYKRMTGYHVLHPMGFDAFGLPTERYAIETGIHPREVTRRNIHTFRRQLKMLGFSYDWSREIITSEPEYYKWTQWIFTVIFNSWYDPQQRRARPMSELPIPDDLRDPEEIEAYKDQHRLTYIAELPVNWCVELGTVLANEEVDEWREKGYTIVRRPMRQWMMRITAYADRLLEDLELVDWPPATKEMQRNWIGKSEGAEILFPVADGSDKVIRVFTTRPDTLFGATYVVLAPEHPLATALLTPEHREEGLRYIEQALQKTERERLEGTKKKTGVFTGSYAINPATREKIPVWIADYVLYHYGTGAIMAVPGHDERDHDFALTFGLPIRQVVCPPDGSHWDIQKAAYVDPGVNCHSANEEISLDGLPTEEAKKRIVEWLEQKGYGKRSVQYKLRDWLFSRQRYWGEPIPVLFYEDGTKRALELDELPLLLPELDDYRPTESGEPPLARAKDWVNIIDPKTGKPARRETNVMPQWAGSCWYYLRFIDPHNDHWFCDPAKERYWMAPYGVDLYVGGAEHAVLHLLYARFWHKVLFDYGYVTTPEPFYKLFHQGLILGEVEYTAFVDNTGRVLSVDAVEENEQRQYVEKASGQVVRIKRFAPEEVEKRGDAFYLREHPDVRVEARAYKMSKSRGNVVNPDDIVQQYGADALRVYEMFMGPLEMTKPWSTSGVEGVFRFLNRTWRMLIDESTNHLSSAVVDRPMTREEAQMLHATIKKVREDIENLRFNTAIAQMMIFVNFFLKQETRPREAMEKFLLCLAPFAPHITEELWHRLGHSRSIHLESFPEYDEALLQKEEEEIVVQVNGKVRGRITVPVDISKEALEAQARELPNVRKYLEGKTVRRVVHVPHRLINFVVG